MESDFENARPSELVCMFYGSSRCEGSFSLIRAFSKTLISIYVQSKAKKAGQYVQEHREVSESRNICLGPSIPSRT